jgi:hypothetical protein
VPFDKDFEHYNDLLELEESKEAIPLAGCRVLSYTKPDGSLFYVVAIAGDMPTSSFIGFLEMAKHDYLSKKEDLEEF